MKQAEVKIGESYLFARTHVAHRKFMEGTVVKVCGKKPGKKKINFQSGILPTGISTGPIRFKLTNGQSCQAAELKPLEP